MLCECKHCHKAYNAPGFSMTCEACKEIDAEIYDRIVDYLLYHPNSNAIQVSDALKIDSKLVLKYVDERRLSLQGPFIEV